MTTSEAADKVRAQRIEGSGFWRSGNQEPRKGKGGGVFLKGVKFKKSGSTSHDPRCNRRRKRRQRLPETASYVPESRVEL
jgi:hypothetical protein